MIPLSTRELDVLRRLCDGRSAKGVARDLGISANTLKDYSQRIRLKLGVKTMIQAAAKAANEGIL